MRASQPGDHTPGEASLYDLIMTVVHPVHADSITDAATRLGAGRIVAFPTETVYGLGGDTFSAPAIDAIYALKGRPADNPLIAHVTDASMALRVAAQWPDAADRLVDGYWPGPLTIVVQRHPAVPAEAAGGRDTIAVRAPAHAAARALLDAFGGPISAPSANRSGHVSPTTAAHVAADFADAADLLVLDGGPCSIGIESTVVDLASAPPRLLRPGSVTVDELRRMLPDLVVPTIAGQEASPGTASAHYAPRRPAELVDPSALDERLGAGGPLRGSCSGAPGRRAAPLHPHAGRRRCLRAGTLRRAPRG